MASRYKEPSEDKSALEAKARGSLMEWSTVPVWMSSSKKKTAGHFGI